MTEEIAALLRLLDEEAAQYVLLLTLARRKADLLSSRAPVEDVENVASQEAQLVNELLPLERDRVEVMRRLAAKLGDKLPQLTVSALCNRLSSDWSDRLGRAMTSLSLTLSELKTVNRLNAALLKQELALVNFSLDVLTNVTSRAVYGNPAAGAVPAGGLNCSALLDARV